MLNRPRQAGHNSLFFSLLTVSEPFGSAAETRRADQLEQADEDVLSLGVGRPKQERWMFDHRTKLSVPVMVGIGAAFDIVTGRVKRAPSWMQENGLEWLFRLAQEPRRLWRRYLIYGPVFAWNVSLELLGLRRFESS